MKTITLPELAVGEIYAGIVLAADGTPSHHLILLPGDADDAPHQAQADWATSIGGELPTRQEQSLLYANAKPHFKSDWYWSGEKESPESEWAWGTNFGNGRQGDYYVTYYELRARAVRRLVI